MVNFLACGSEIYDFIENNSEKVFEESREPFFKKFLFRLLTKYLQNQTYGNLHKKQKAMLVLAMQG